MSLINQKTIVKVKFVNKPASQFFNVLRKRVDNYFIENKISKHANRAMVIKTISMITMYLVPYLLIVTLGNMMGLLPMFLLTVLMGVGMAGIGASVMHDANHGAYS